MSWDALIRYPVAPQGSGRPLQRLVRGLIWAVVAIAIIVLLALWIGTAPGLQVCPPDGLC